MKPIVSVAALASLLLTTLPASADLRPFSLGQWGELGIELPARWTATAQGNDAAGGTVIRIVPGGDTQLVLLMTPVPAPGKAVELEAAAQKAVEAAKVGLGKNAVESELRVRELRSDDSHGYYVSATDKTVEEPSATSFKYVDQGAVVVGRLMVSFTILTNAMNDPVRMQAREIVRLARHLPAGAPWRTPEGGVAVSYPGKAWKVALDLPGYEIGPFQLGAEGKGVKFSGRNAATRMIVTVVLDEAHPGWTAVDHREDAWKKMLAEEEMDREDVQRSERGPMAVLEMRVPTYSGQEVNEKSVYAHLVRDGIRVDVQLSKIGFQESEKELFEKVLGSVRFVD